MILCTSFKGARQILARAPLYINTDEMTLGNLAHYGPAGGATLDNGGVK